MLIDPETKQNYALNFICEFMNKFNIKFEEEDFEMIGR